MERLDRRLPFLAVALLLGLVLGAQLLAGVHLVDAQGTVGNTITFQGQLMRNGGLVDRVNCDFQFSLYDAASGGNQLGNTITVTGLAMTNGYFTADLDFGAQFSGDRRYLQVGVRCPPDPAGRYLPLDQRFDLTATPYAVYASTAGSVGSVGSAATALRATNVITAQQVTGVDWSQLLNRPAGLDDGDDDTLANVCSAGAGNNNRVAKFDGMGAWTCEVDNDVDTLRDLKSSCDADEIAVFNDNAWVCAQDANNTYTAGTGLDLNGTDLSLLLAYRLPLSCTNQYTAKWSGTARAWVCAQDKFNAYTAGQGIDAAALGSKQLKVQVSQIAGSGLADDGDNNLRVDTAGIIGDGLTTDGSENIRFDAAAVAGAFLAADAQNQLNVDAAALAGDGLADLDGKLSLATGGVGMRELSVPMGGDESSWTRLDDPPEYKFPVLNIGMNQDGKCLVIATGTIKSPGNADDNPHGYLRAVIRIDTTITSRPLTAVSYFGNIENADNATASWVFTVSQGDVVDFGCRVYATENDWLDDENWTCTVSYFCR